MHHLPEQELHLGDSEYMETSTARPVVATTSATTEYVFIHLFKTILLTKTQWSSNRWQNAPLTVEIKESTARVNPKWNDTHGAWGRIFDKSLLTYAHLLLRIAKECRKSGYQANVKDNVDKKTYGSFASKQGFQMGSYIKAINRLISKGVSKLLFDYIIFYFYTIVLAF